MSVKYLVVIDFEATKTIDESENFDVVLQKFYSWLESISFINSSKEKTQDWIFLTVSDNDLKILITSQLICSQITQREEIFNQWIDLQKIFCWHYGYEKRKRLMHMLEYLEIRSEGSLHSGLDDSKNTAKIVVKMILDGAIFSKDDSTDWKPTKQWKKWDLLNKKLQKEQEELLKEKKNHNNEKFFWDTSKTIYQQNSDFQKHLSKIGKSTTQKDYFDDSDDDMFFI
ncbi:3'-5' exonuclease eri1-related [Anaeramoeba flamelloides]|uniref:3'-5' exonuclease eri1-related n=1 Tax=Anaeramoeba flamelloides TaxID=1746091 RepID=A0ABQ8XI92_9EUKA|nr:3'-5' exonuclease eri1-related [Anaeramoeba flamelloides]